MDQNRTPLLDAVAAYARREPAYFKIPAHRFERGISPDGENGQVTGFSVLI